MPFDHYTWTRLLGERKKRLLLQKGILVPGKSSVSELRIGEMEYRVESVNGKWYALHEDADEIELVYSDIRKLEFDKAAFAREIAQTLEIQNPVSKLFGSDGFFLGRIPLGQGYRVFLCFTPRDFIQAISNIVGEERPFVIAFDKDSGEIQKYTAERQGEYLPIDSCVGLTDQGFEAIGTLKELLGSPRARRMQGYYSWASTGNPIPDNPRLSMLKISIVGPVELSISFGGKSMKFHREDISFLRDERTKDGNANWIYLNHAAMRKAYVGSSSPESLARAIKRLNASVREFFGLKRETAFSIRDSLIIANFKLEAPYLNDRRIRSQVFKR